MEDLGAEASREMTTDLRPVRPTTDTIRVAALLEASAGSGPARQLAALAGAAKVAGVEMILVLFHRRGRPDSPLLEQVTNAGLDYRILSERRAFDLGLVGQLHRTLGELKVNLIETHGYKSTALAYLLRRRGSLLPWVAFFHGATAENLKVRFYHWLDRQCMRSADRIVVMSRLAARDFAHLGPPVEVIHNAAIRLAEETHTVEQSQLRYPQGIHPLVGVIGRLSPEKGVDVFIEAARILQDRGEPFNALVVGDGPDRSRLEALCAKLDLGSSVHFVGYQRDMRPVYAALDLLVVPSRSEGLPNVLLEALRAHLPVVATAVGAIPEVLDHPKAGILVAPGNPRALADGMATALIHLGDPEWKEAARAASTRFSLANRVAAHKQLYLTLLGASSDERVGIPGSVHV